MQSITHSNHYVPQFLLRKWSLDDSTIWSYRLLVSHAHIPLWKPSPISGIACRPDLYTFLAATGEEVDEFERWLKEAFEDPAVEAIDSLVNGGRVSPKQWGRIARFAAAQDLRTPASYSEHSKRLETGFPEILTQVAERADRVLTARRDAASPAPPGNDTAETALGSSVRIRLEPDFGAPAPEGKCAVKVEMLAGRKFWMDTVRHVLGNAARIATEHQWSIAAPHGDKEWITSDDPVVRLNYYSPGKYDFRGGWGKRGTELLLPLSPRHLLYTHVKSRRTPARFDFDATQTDAIQRFLAEKAHRWIFAKHPMPDIERLRQRWIRPEDFKAEEEAWRNWSANQARADPGGQAGLADEEFLNP